jgi:Holliday junction resolvase RusA-like endonuclease
VLGVPRMIYIIKGINPEPWTSPSGAVQRGKGGKPYVQMHKSSKLANFQKALANALDGAPMMTPGPGQHIDLDIYVWRALETSTRTSGRQARGHQADATNLQKAIEDACQDVVFGNDRDNRRVRTTIVEQGHDTEPMIILKVTAHLDTDLAYVDVAAMTRRANFIVDRSDKWEGDDVSVKRDVPDSDLF